MQQGLTKKKIVVLTGAGVSAESGLKTFRDSDGLWEGYDVTEVATPGAWRRDPELVLEFYNMRRRNVMEAQPNDAHYGLAALQKDFEVHIVTQNIDDLHERAGSRNVLHLHGEIFKMRSEKNEQLLYDVREDMHMGDTAGDGAQLRPAIVWFEEPVPMIEVAVPLARSADIFVVVGTSLLVYPAAGLLHVVPRQVPTFIIDKKIPIASASDNMYLIEQKATEGVQTLTTLLRDRWL
ncbi:MAG TPA: NAD-dependent deacylase [Puia sp.]|nr:NAD-dependent deacylase [Puia sp.]